MKVYNEKHNNLNKNLISTLFHLRKMRGFNADKCIEAKAIVLNEYMRTCGLNACVVAVSGGVDSAAVLSLVVHAKKQDKSPIEKIVAITLPVKDEKSATNQTQSVSKAQELGEILSLDVAALDVTRSYREIYPQVEEALEQIKPDNWARGQLCAYARTPIIYYCTSVLSSQGFRSIVVGTTNRDEGAYLGYVGKASDAMVDVQLISDLHKSEVYQIAQQLNVPQSILDAAPNGDMYDGRVDEEVFGAPYDFVELYLNHKNLSDSTWKSLTKIWDENDWQQFSQYSQALEKLHHYNSHKYWIGSPAIHLDVYPSAVKGGWTEGVHSGMYKSIAPVIIPTHRFVGFVDKSPQLSSSTLCAQTFNEETYKIKQINNLLDLTEIEHLLSWIKENKSKMSSTDEFGKATNQAYQGAQRLSFYCEEFTKTLAERLLINDCIEPVRFFDEQDNTNWRPDRLWKFVGINPMVRVIQYNQGGYLVPHYDDSFVQNEYRKSLVTLVIILQNNCIGGATRFLIDQQNNLPFEQRDFSDWLVQPQHSQIYKQFKPPAGGALLFDHRLLHDGQIIESGEKIILRTELMFESCIFKRK